jgi:hypothetical protein
MTCPYRVRLFPQQMRNPDGDLGRKTWKSPGGPCGMIVRMSNRAKGPSAAQEAWVRHSEALWCTAHAIAAADPDLDAGDVYHALRSLELTPAERLHRGLTRVRHRSHPG